VTADRTETEVLEIAAAQADARRALNDERVAAMEPESPTDVLRERLARRRGQLNVSSGNGG
jgi:hypothetical protein